MERLSSLTLNQLEAFATVAREGTFTRAGEVLRRSESAVSQQIKLLETSLGAKLLVRSPGRPVRLTESGQLMLASCETILKHLERTVAEVEAIGTLDRESVVIGSGPYFGSYLLPRICASFQRLMPRVTVHLQTAKGADCVEAVRRRDVEFAVVGGEVLESGVVQSHLASRDVVWIAPSNHALASRSRIPFPEVIAEKLVLAPRTSSNRRVLEKYAGRQGLRLPASLEVGGVEAQVMAVLSGLGISAVQSHVLQRYKDAPLSVLSVEGFPLRGSWSVVWRDHELSQAANAFRDHLLRQQAEIEATSLYAPRWGGTRSALARRSDATGVANLPSTPIA